MKSDRNDRFNFRAWGAAAVTAAFFVPLLVFGAPALAKSAASQYQYSGSSQYQYKVLICHRTHSHKHPWVLIRVGAPAARAHMRHGDQPAPCPTTAPSGHDKHGDHGNKGKGDDDNHGSTTTTTTTTTGSSSSRGGGDKHGGGHGNGGDHGNGHGHGK